MSEYLVRQARILLVDDDDRHSDAVKAILQYFGHSVVISISRAEASQLIESESQTFDLVIAAYTMLEDSTHTLIRQLRALSPKLPLLVFMDLDTQIAPDSLDMLRIGTVLPKPIWGRELDETIQQFLEAVVKPLKRVD